MKKESKLLQEGLNYVRDRLDYVYEEYRTPDYVEVHGVMGGDNITYRVYPNGTVCEK